VSRPAPPHTWTRHPAARRFGLVQAFPSAGGDAYFALHRSRSSFDGEDALRPYVFRMEGRTHRELWSGTALAYPLVAARLIQIGGKTLLCAIHRDDSFLRPRPATLGRRRVVYRWTGFGFVAAQHASALATCEAM
jgi:hypothetical protein